MEDVLDEVVSSEDLQKFEKIFHEQLHQGKVTHKAQFEYAWCLVRSKYPTDIRKGILLLKELFNSHQDGKRDYLFYLAIGNARIKEYNKALHYVKSFLEIEPANQQVLTLEKTKKAMSKDEVSLLVDLIQSHPIITTKETNASTNRLKEESWASITSSFNAKSGQTPRQLSQLKLKWDNLKKAARKRAANIRMNHLKTGGGKPDFITPDEILERVTGVFGSTCSGFDVPFGGDGVGGTANVIFELDSADDIMQLIPETNCAEVNVPDEPLLPSSTMKKRKIDFSPPLASGGNTDEQGGRHIYGMTSMSKALQSKGKKLKTKQDYGQLQRNLAIAKYYEKKTEKLDIEIKLLKLANKENNVNNNI